MADTKCLRASWFAILVTIFLCVGSAAAQEWGPINGGGHGVPRPIDGPILAEIRAVDASREIVLSKKFLLFRETKEGKSVINILAPGTLEHEDHAQIRIQLLEGEHQFFDLLEHRLPSDETNRRPQPIASVAVVVRGGTIRVHELKPSSR